MGVPDSTSGRKSQFFHSIFRFLKIKSNQFIPKTKYSDINEYIKTHQSELLNWGKIIFFFYFYLKSLLPRLFIFDEIHHRECLFYYIHFNYKKSLLLKNDLRISSQNVI